MSFPARKITGQPVLRYRFDGFEALTGRARPQAGRCVPLTPKPTDTLLLLMEHAGETAPKEDLLAQVQAG
ncbi:hypothetical protein SBA4_4060015 [Candidatus Sulfopaludibacter sp. SbA4]|nr:hypothetical protein SBA4_4060015 [Candidatus Sulfopaludibacter sp. SbA4]